MGVPERVTAKIVSLNTDLTINLFYMANPCSRLRKLPVKVERSRNLPHQRPNVHNACYLVMYVASPARSVLRLAKACL